jgi:excisionase family DNA binding protein
MAVNAITTEQLALVLGVSDRHIRRLVSQGVLTRLKTAAGDPMPGHYDLVSSVRAYTRYLRDLAPAGDTGETQYRQLRNQRMGSEAEMA